MANIRTPTISDPLVIPAESRGPEDRLSLRPGSGQQGPPLVALPGPQPASEPRDPRLLAPLAREPPARQPFDPRK
jgi:hypothetical protein